MSRLLAVNNRGLLGAVVGLFVFSAAGIACQSAQPTGTPPAPGPEGSQEQVKRGGTLRAIWSGTFPHMDMHQVGVLGIWNSVNLVYNGLIEWDARDKRQGTVTPSLAKSWESNSDATQFTFKLQEGVKWHDGKPVTAEDVVFSLQRIFTPPKGTISARQEQFSMVEKVEAKDPTTIVVTTKFPSANFMTLIADGWHVIVPKHVVEKEGHLKQVAIGTGPYKFVEFVPNQRFVAERNPDYFKPGLPYLDRIELYNFAEETTVVAALLTNQLDMLSPAGQGVSSSGVRDIQARNPTILVERNARLQVSGWIYNVTRPPLDKLAVRQALNLAIDRQEYAKFFTDFGGIFGTVVFPGSVWDLPKAEQEKLVGYEPNYEERLARAKKMLADAGFPNGGFTLSLLGSTGAGFDDNAEALEALLGRVGVKIKREPAPGEEARQREREGLFDIFAGGLGGIATIDPVGVVGDHFLCKSGRNTSRFCDPGLDQLYEQQLKILDQNERIKVVHEMIKRAVNGAALNVLYWPNEHHARWPYVKGFIVTPSRYTGAAKLEYVWLDK